MKNATATNQKRHPKFGSIAENADLGIGIMIFETEDEYRPLAPVSTIREAREFAAHDLAHRMKSLEHGGEPACPSIYKVWSQDSDGTYAICAELDPSSL